MKEGPACHTTAEQVTGFWAVVFSSLALIHKGFTVFVVLHISAEAIGD